MLATSSRAPDCRAAAQPATACRSDQRAARPARRSSSSRPRYGAVIGPRRAAPRSAPARARRRRSRSQARPARSAARRPPCPGAWRGILMTSWPASNFGSSACASSSMPSISLEYTCACTRRATEFDAALQQAGHVGAGRHRRAGSSVGLVVTHAHDRVQAGGSTAPEVGAVEVEMEIVVHGSVRSGGVSSHRAARASPRKEGKRPDTFPDFAGMHRHSAHDVAAIDIQASARDVARLRRRPGIRPRP